MVTVTTFDTLLASVSFAYCSIAHLVTIAIILTIITCTCFSAKAEFYAAITAYTLAAFQALATTIA